MKYGLLSTSQIESKIFSGIDSSTVLRRLRRLEQAGWIYRIQALRSGENTWLLTRRGETTMQVRAPMTRPNRNGVEHDVLLTETRMRLESIGLGENFVLEWSLRRQTFRRDKRGRESDQVIPDGVFSATLWDNKLVTVALELELHAKTTRRYEKIFTKYREKESLGLIWYFVRSESFAESLIAKWNEIKIPSWKTKKDHAYLIVTILSEFEKSPRGARLFFTDGDHTPIEEFFKVTKAQSPPAQAVGTQAPKNLETEIVQRAS